GAYRDGLGGYLATTSPTTTVGLGRPSSGARAGGGGVSVIATAQVVDDRGVPRFEKVDRAHVEWGLDRLKGVIEPALAGGKGADYSADRARAEGLSGERSYSGVYRWFYSPDHAITVSRLPNGRFDVTDGYHRLYVAKDMGISELPAVIR